MKLVDIARVYVLYLKSQTCEHGMYVWASQILKYVDTKEIVFELQYEKQIRQNIERLALTDAMFLNSCEIFGSLNELANLLSTYNEYTFLLLMREAEMSDKYSPERQASAIF
ncbi:MAG: hypothetical protein EOO45_03260 [Flavobacterium sp.]|nr:MAG: hypothetical protein EOO45_03260 [Flavobacterium sp.]